MRRLAILALVTTACAAQTHHVAAPRHHRSSFDGGQRRDLRPETTTSTQHAVPVRASRSETRPSRVGTASRPGEGACPDVHEWHALVDCLPWPTMTFHSIIGCESGWRADAYNPSSGATGPLQILNGPTDPEASIRLGFSMWLRRGLGPWYPSRRCWA